MKPTSEAILLLDDETVATAVALIRADAMLGRGSASSWEEVTPSDYEAAERLRALVEEGVVRVAGKPTPRATPRAILRAMREAEPRFWSTEAS